MRAPVLRSSLLRRVERQVRLRRNSAQGAPQLAAGSFIRLPINGGGPPCFISEEWCNAYPVAPKVETGALGLLDWVNAASFIMRAAPDALNPDDQSNAEHFFYGLDGLGTHGVKTPALYFDMGESGHASWLFLGNNLHVPRITARTMVAWLKTYFHGWSLDEYFTGKVVQKDIDAGYIAAVDER